MQFANPKPNVAWFQRIPSLSSFRLGSPFRHRLKSPPFGSVTASPPAGKAGFRFVVSSMTRKQSSWLGYTKNTPRKINIEPGNDGLEDDFPGMSSQVPC